MLARLFLGISIFLGLISGCVPVQATDVFEVAIEPATEASANEAVKVELRPVMQAMLSGRITNQLSLVQYTPIPCANVEALGGPPRCPEGVAEGTVVDAFPILDTEGSFAKPEEMENVLSNTLVKSLYAVYTPVANPRLESYYPTGEHAMLFERDRNDLPLPVVLHVIDGKIVRMDLHSGVSAADLLKEVPVEQVVITPAEARAWTGAN